MPTNDVARNLLTLTEDELSRIILDVHDGPVQYLYTALSLLTGIQQESEQAAPAPDLKPRLAQVGMLLESSLYEIRFFMGAMRPPEFRTKCLVAILEALAIQHEERTGSTVHLAVDQGVNGPAAQVLPFGDVALPVKIALYRILQEALSNSYRHAGVTEHFVRLWSAAGYLHLEVRDEGRGFDPATTELESQSVTEKSGEHLGLRGMQERASLIGGQFTLKSQLGAGTSILVTIPVAEFYQ